MDARSQSSIATGNVPGGVADAPALDIVAVSKRYGDVHALDGLDLRIECGEYFGLLGPNGAGKSTLINSISGLVRPDSGSIRVLGHDNRSEFRVARRLLGVVPQELVFDPFFKVEDVLRIQAGYYGCGPEAQPWIEELIQRLDLGFKRRASMRTLSGGQKRRVMIAQALVHRPQVVILDEPTAGVDVELRRTLWKFTRELNAAGTTIVLTTHYLDEAQALCHRIAIVDHGKLKLVETTEALLARNPWRFLQLKLAAGTVLPAVLEPLVASRTNGSVELKLHRDEHSIGEVMAALKAADVDILDMHTREPRLEDVFIDLTYGARNG
ncbi:MAG: ABC transporter ATP-binding protein [Nevskiaceae bacterium]|nr:MAG: ABC transporter ATP-binding protein [Nevskiaceae bacterium]TBR73350.1 MAG: ABC transporter ATP-binding protein [Nevskiaceae bacterium]